MNELFFSNVKEHTFFNIFFEKLEIVRDFI